MSALSHIPDVLLALLGVVVYLAGVGAAFGFNEGRIECSRHASTCKKATERCAQDCDCGRERWEYRSLGQAHDLGCERELGATLGAMLWPLGIVGLLPWSVYLLVQTPRRRKARRLAHEKELEAMEAELFGRQQ
jgi:hypothetical protein